MAYYITPPEKVGGHVSRVPHQIAPMLTTKKLQTRIKLTLKTQIFLRAT